MSSSYSYEWPSGTSIYGSSCSGHESEDVVPFSNFAMSDAKEAGTSVTNAELYDLLDPAASNTNYVYDHFEWVECADEGIDLRGDQTLPDSNPAGVEAATEEEEELDTDDGSMSDGFVEPDAEDEETEDTEDATDVVEHRYSCLQKSVKWDHPAYLHIL